MHGRSQFFAQIIGYDVDPVTRLGQFGIIVIGIDLGLFNGDISAGHSLFVFL